MAGKGGEGLGNLNFFPRVQTLAHPDCDCTSLQGLRSLLPPAIWGPLLTQLPTAPSSLLIHPSFIWPCDIHGSDATSVPPPPILALSPPDSLPP